MAQPETQAVLVPPPPRPPSGAVAAAAPDPSREPSRSVRPGFLFSVMAEVRRVVWPRGDSVWASTLVTIGLLAAATLLIWLLNQAAQALFSALGRV